MEQTLEQPTLAPIDPAGIREAWEMVTSQLRMEMKPALYETWVAPLKPLGYKEGVFRVGAANIYAREWVEGHLRTRITRLIESFFDQPVSVHFALAGGGSGTVSAPAPDGIEKAPGSNGGNGSAARRKRQPAGDAPEEGSARKIQLQRAYGSERARVIQPERGMFLTLYFLNSWLPLLGHSAAATVLAARSLCYWNPMTGELRNVVETDMTELASRAAVSLRTVKDVLNNELIRRFFLRYKVRRMMTPNGVRTAGILLQVRMDDPLTPEDQDQHQLTEDERWYTVDFEDED